MVGADFDRSGGEIEREPRVRYGWRRAAVASVALACIIAVVSAGGVRTKVWFVRRSGSPGPLILQDGSQVTLDTSSSIRVEESDSRRLVRLLAGRARFQVARDPARPFIVRAGGQQVIALGTVFTVTSEADQTSIVLENGQVMVRSDQQGASGGCSRGGTHTDTGRPSRIPFPRCYPGTGSSRPRPTGRMASRPCRFRGRDCWSRRSGK